MLNLPFSVSYVSLVFAAMQNVCAALQQCDFSVIVTTIYWENGLCLGRIDRVVESSKRCAIVLPKTGPCYSAARTFEE